MSSTVHTTAAGCEYLLDEARLDAADRVTLLTAAEPDAAERDAGDAANVATARLTGFLRPRARGARR
jgi:hypothetical protein